ncbi:DUF4837 family protein [Gangjinia marincola]|uniref:DUF4837 family protein n=1 Tax=Gangjinia marincola TaxID=578463 RepID=A0ABN1MHV4_9FLAO
MKKTIFFALSCAFLISCGSKDSNTKNDLILSNSSGNINTLLVVMPEEGWNGETGEVIREVFAAPVDGLPQEEPLFSMSHITPKTFSGFTKKSRIFLKIQQAKTAGIESIVNKYAKPQQGFVITGPNKEAVHQLIKENGDKMIAAYKSTERSEKIRRVRKSLNDTEPLEEALGITLKFPTAYRYAKQEDDFVWIRKEIPNGSMEILAYQIPYHRINKDSVVTSIIKMRDSIGAAHIPGPLEGSYMQTEKAFAPYLFDANVAGRKAYETKGMWDVTNAFMAGPFVNYVIEDKEKDRYVVIEGFVFKPSAAKRDQIFELEAILRSVVIQ